MAQLQRIAIAPSQFQKEQIILTQEQQHYLVRVLRLRNGDRFIAMDGLGKWWIAQLQGTQAQVLEPLEVKTELPVSINLIVALPKGNAFDEVVRCCTELGVGVIAPVISDRTLLNPSPQKLERWRRIAQEAAEQSERLFVPTILEPVGFSSSLVDFQRSTNQQYICEARGNYPHLRDCLRDKGEMTITIAIGPEGGWTQEEVECAIAANFQPVSLGRRILRTVTAPIVALSIVAAELESK
ncbi:16S rRNA (uracil(1498)-N(3))-methyltransferase [Aetokthonos hydrillicola Thurmond2011]|jgi:16S rRNA (uracil1498-N3)-methyltransferase|uniref:Ribosomal RNA small subunit methyltransferase E n=1 Tax=Aetokthonos hydrillicola Thurmond2011 TaxID=2712845 RepID=A0AAP5IEM3_9CYAN|nr:16S rRNA (uracil(1498)-N(3))-methyltransferase [Aetokthonos hydrillicola]MBO3459669.1 16S rRNA (uracil(1498)-N(3))-methyltransferase [Aetokthonos hydrillicola CCALA 1050]MBW4589033.1 16S rRNA (uracil(1498)-N(3))-methyltransferase [Aetokthonos hydrillicola CCALA 1050]MDR9900106.1 16S rRNA (uracil(1498)-N(3))-methyltransferase [Aetokthonos hydrillicola Thurmond2011]